MNVISIRMELIAWYERQGYQKTAETKEPVTLTQPNITVRGKGLQADLNTGDIKLLSETRGDYAINQ